MNARADTGDSGSPVCYWDAVGGYAELAELVYNKDKNSNKPVFSSLRSIENELGALQTSDPD